MVFKFKRNQLITSLTVVLSALLASCSSNPSSNEVSNSNTSTSTSASVSNNYVFHSSLGKTLPKEYPNLEPKNNKDNAIVPVNPEAQAQDIEFDPTYNHLLIKDLNKEYPLFVLSDLQKSDMNLSFTNPDQLNQISKYTYERNLPILFSEGFLPVILGKNIPVTSINTSPLLVAQSSLPKNFSVNLPTVFTEPGANAFQGSGVTVYQIDGRSDYSGHENIYAYTPQKVDVSNIVGTDPNYNKLAADENHGFRVGSIIIGKRNQFSSGLVPDVNFYYAELPYESVGIGDFIIDGYNQVLPSIINNSYTFPYSEDADSIYKNVERSLSLIAAKKNAPLLVFASGNTNAANFKVPNNDYVKYLSNLSSFGEDIFYNSSLYHLLQNDQISKDIIVATGVYYDPSNRLLNAMYWKFLNKLVPVDKQQDVYNQVPEPKIDESKLAVGTPLDPTRFYSPLGAIKCGLVMYDCISSSYIYHQPFYNRSNVIRGYEHSSTGTSFAAPVIVAVAAMVKQQFPWMTASNLKTTILTTATDIGDRGVDPIYGWGVVNAANALRGPSQFAFGDFEADLSFRTYRPDNVQPHITTADANLNSAEANAGHSNTVNLAQSYNSYFLNSISGPGGLIVNGGNNDYLYLAAVNSYTGNTIVNSGNLVLVAPSDIGVFYSQDSGISNQAYINSNIYVNHLGRFYMIDAIIGNDLYNNGLLLFKNVLIGGNFTQTTNGTLFVDVDRGTNYIKGEANLAGKLKLMFSPSAESTSQQLQRIVLVAEKGYTGKFDFDANAYNTPLATYDIDYTNNLKVALNMYLHSLVPALNRMEAKDTTNDKSNLFKGAKHIASFLPATQSHDLFHAKPIKPSQQKPQTVDSSTQADNGVVNHVVSTNANSESNSGLVATTASLASNQDVDVLAKNQDLVPKSVGTIGSKLLTSAKTTTRTQTAQSLTLVGAAIETMSLDQLQQLFYRNASTVYSDLRFVSETSHHNTLNSFIDTVGNSFSRNDSKIYGYLNYSFGDTAWSNPKDTSVNGDMKARAYSGGVYTQLHHFNLGLGYFFNRINWNEQVNLVSPTTQTQQTIDLGKAKAQSHTLALNLGYTTNDSYYNATFFANLSNNQVTRSSIYTNDQIAKFNTYGLGVVTGYGKQIFDLGEDGGVVLSSTVNWQFHYQGKFVESAQKSNDQATSTAIQDFHQRQSAQLSLDAKSKTTWDAYSNLGLKLFKGFNLGTVKNYVFTQANLSQYIFTPTYSLDLNNSLAQNSADSAFSNKTLLTITAGYRLIVNSFSFNLSASYQYSSNWHHYQVQAGVSYGF